MFLTDSSVWIDHLRRPDFELTARLRARRVLMHPFVIGEIAMGSIANRTAVLAALGQMRRARMANDDEVLALVERERLFSIGLGFVDAHLLASAMLTPDTRLWTRDKRLRDAAARLGIAGAPI